MPGTPQHLKPPLPHPHPPRRAARRCAHRAGRGGQAPGELAKPHEPAMPRSMT
jgi:hypothetical protein